MKNGMVRPQDISEFAGRIYDEASRLTSLVQDIIEISKLDEKSGEMPFENVDIYEIAQDICQNLTLQSKKKNITLSIEGSNVEIYGVRHILYEMCYNLVDNAIKYTPAGSHIVLSAAAQGESAVIRVSDDGPGIPDEAKEKVFEMFSTGEKRISDSRRSLGLGLALCRTIIAAHGGTITLSDNKPHGCIFTFTLPLGEVSLHE